MRQFLFLMVASMLCCVTAPAIAQDTGSTESAAASAGTTGSLPMRLVLVQGDGELVSIPVPRTTYQNLVDLYEVRTKIQNQSGSIEAILQSELFGLGESIRQNSLEIISSYELQAGLVSDAEARSRMKAVVAAEAERRALIKAKVDADLAARQAERDRQLAALQQAVADAKAQAELERQALMDRASQ